MQLKKLHMAKIYIHNVPPVIYSIRTCWGSKKMPPEEILAHEQTIARKIAVIL
jgi:hypothetical protein